MSKLLFFLKKELMSKLYHILYNKNCDLYMHFDCAKYSPSLLFFILFFLVSCGALYVY